MTKKIYGFRLEDETIKILDEYQKFHTCSTRTEALRQMIIRNRVNPESKPIPQPTTQGETEIENDTPKIDFDKKISCPDRHNRLGNYFRCQKCGKKSLQKVRDCNSIPPDWKEDIVSDLEDEQREEDKREQERRERVAPEESEEEPNNEEPDKEKTVIQTTPKLFEGYIKCPKEERLVDPADCLKICPKPEDRQACATVRAETKQKA